MKKHLCLLLLLLCGISAHAQVFSTGNLTASAGSCNAFTPNVAAMLVQPIGSNTGSATITLSGTFSATVSFYSSGNGGATWSLIAGAPVGGGSSVTSATVAGTWSFTVPSLTHLCALASTFSSGSIVTAISTSTSPNNLGSIVSNLTGISQGQKVIGGATGGVNSSANLDVLGFVTGALSPCAGISSTIGATPATTGGTDIEAAGIGNGNVMNAAFTNTGCGALDSNFMKKVSAAGTILNNQICTGNGVPVPACTASGSTNGILGGKVHLGGFTLRLSLVPAMMGTCLSNAAGNDCSATIPGPQFPPSAVVVIPNKDRGIEGLGRGDAGGQNTTLQICTALNTPAQGCVAPTQRHWTISSTTAATIAGRTYLTIAVTPNSVSGVNITSAATGAALVTMPDHTMAAQISSGMTINITAGTTFAAAAYSVCSGKLHTNAGTTCSGANNIPPYINASGQLVFAIGTATTGTDASDTITVGSNVVCGEYVSVEGNPLASNMNDGDWRVACTSANALNGTSADSNATVTPSNLSFQVVGVNSTLSPLMKGFTSVSCSPTCGIVHAEIPIADLGNPQTVAGKFQFATGLQNLTLNCNSSVGGPPAPTIDCVPWRNVSSDEQTYVIGTLSNNYMLWGADVHSTINQNAQRFLDNEFISGGDINNTCLPGLTTAVFADVGPRNWEGWTGNFNGCVNQSPTAGMYVDANTTVHIANGHAESVVFNVLCGQNQPCQGLHYEDNGGVATGSCPYQNGNGGGSANNICAENDGPYQVSTTTTALITSGSSVNIAVTSSTGCAIGMNSVLDVNALAEASTVTAVPDGTHVTVANVKNSKGGGGVQFSCSANAASVAISGNFPTAINGAQSAFTGDYSIQGCKKNTGGVNCVVDDYMGQLSADNFVGFWIVDTNGSGGCKTLVTSSGTVPSSFCGNVSIGSGNNCNTTSGTVSPAACGSAAQGTVKIAAAATTFTVNTTAVKAGAQITYAFNVADTNCTTAPANIATLTPPYTSTITGGTSFIFTLGTGPTTNPLCVDWMIR